MADHGPQKRVKKHIPDTGGGGGDIDENLELDMEAPDVKPVLDEVEQALADARARRSKETKQERRTREKSVECCGLYW